MKSYIIEYTLYLSEFLTSLSFTITASFYPGVAEEKGISLWLIGFIFSIDPLIGLPTSLIAGKYMNRLGRKSILILGILLGSTGMLTLGLVEHSSYFFAVFFSILSRSLAGIGAGCSMTAAPAILVSQYPEDIDRVIGMFEAASGLGSSPAPFSAHS